MFWAVSARDPARRMADGREGALKTMDSTERTAVITGAGAGLGKDIALGLTAKGYRVWGTARSLAEIADLATTSNGRAALSVVDITDTVAVEEFAASVTAQLPAGLDVLFSNAGILTPGPLEVVSLDEIRLEFEVNVFGALATVNAFLPALRAARGRVVFTSAMTAAFPLPFNGPSSASKAALEAFADVYRNELHEFGVDVVIAQAGNLATGGPAKSAQAVQRTEGAMTPSQRELYGEVFHRFATSMREVQAAGIPSAEAAGRMIDLAEQEPAPIRAAVGPDAERILALVAASSDEELDQTRRQLLG